MAGLKLKIDNEALAEEFFEDALLLGIVAPVHDYMFCWQINQAMGIDFRVNNDIEIQLTKKNRKYFFSIYEYPVPAIKLVHYLYNNQNDGEYLLPEFRHLDFLWLIKGEGVGAEDLLSLTQMIRHMPGVQLVTEMTSEKIKNKQHLIF
ncbi:MAG: IPExxxVDY family protein [Chitinophagaceae bacterium]|nr:IPExxxVDY family protein [Chitinophagaceae bacterium]MBL0055377.1 IPExxxVDY family protein [Chitinophagaceae bacterium]